MLAYERCRSANYSRTTNTLRGLFSAVLPPHAMTKRPISKRSPRSDKMHLSISEKIYLIFTVKLFPKTMLQRRLKNETNENNIK